MGRSRKLKMYEFVGDVIDCGMRVLIEQGDIAPEKARAMMTEVAKAICFKNAKSNVYIPEARNLENMSRNAGIWQAYQNDGPPPQCNRKFSPARAEELAVQHDLSRQQVYNILAEQRRAESGIRQGELPGLEEFENA